MINLSVVILTKNEEKNIENCIKSVSFADETLVIDDYSTDKTTEIARKLGVKVYSRSLENDFAEQRNYGLRRSQSQWVLFLDADERITPLLREEIVRSINNPTNQYGGLSLTRKDFFMGRELRYGETASIRLLRLAKKDTGEWRRKVHEYWDVRGKTGELRNPIYHYPHQSLKEFIAHINFYSDLHARANFEEGKKSNLIKIVLIPIIKFLDNYFFKLGLLDSLQGFVFAMTMSLHSFLAWSKLWLIQEKLK